MGSLEKAIVPLLVASLGVGVGLALIDAGSRIWVGLTGLALAVVGYFVRDSAEKALPDRPNASRKRFEWSLLLQAVVAVYAAGFLLWLAIASDVPQSAPTATKKAVAALAAAVTAAVTAAFIKDAENADEAWVARSMKKAFRRAYDDAVFPLPEPSRSHVHSDTRGWSRDERRDLALELQKVVDGLRARESGQQ